jgi:hypothetical protein
VSRAARFGSWLVRPLRELLAEDRSVALIALGFVASELVAFGWDLPGSHGWENDGVAPRDLFGGLAHNLTPGHTHRYPLLHYLLLAVSSLPALLAAVLSGPLTSEAIQARVLSVPCMTALSLVAKAVATLMGVVSILVLARIVRRTLNSRAARYAALFAATNLTFAFYARVSNLDVPYLMWTVLGLDALLDVVESGERRAYTRFGSFVALAVATKDQAYASFVLVAPVYFVLWPLLARRHFSRAHARLTVRGAVVAVLVYGLASGALLNPTGFVRRLAELRGPSSQAWRVYSTDLLGLAANLRDTLRAAGHDFWPAPLFALALLGVVLALAHRPGVSVVESRTARALPLFAGLSSFVFFTLVVGRNEHRFLLPFGFFLSAYAGAAADALIHATRLVGGERGERFGAGVVAFGVVWCGLMSLGVHLTQLGDARREVAAFLRKLPPGSRVETYGLVVYAPHFDVSPTSPYRVTRVGRERARTRNPLVGARELEAPIADVEARQPDVLVLSEGFAHAYLAESADRSRPLSGIVKERQGDRETAAYVRAAVTGNLRNYRLALAARPRLPRWASALGLRPVGIQGTTALSLWVLVREKSSPALPLPPTDPPHPISTY